MPRNKLSAFDRDVRKQISQNLKRLTENITQYDLSEMTGIPASTLSGYFAMRSTPSAGNVQKIADALHVDKSEIDPRFSSDFLKSKEYNTLSPKEERNIEKDLEDIMHSVSSAVYVSEYGQQPNIESFKAALRTVMILAKGLAKKKYTPRKYRKE